MAWRVLLPVASSASDSRRTGDEGGDMTNERVRRAVLPVVAALGLILGSSAVAATSDPWITTKAKLALLTTSDVHATGINVDTIDGRVTLHGKVTSEAEKTKAEDTVKGIQGVTGVRNLLQVVAERRENAVESNDKDIKTRVEKTLANDKAFKDVSVQSVNAGVVLLAGEVPTLTDHLNAVTRVSEVPGVRHVASEIKSPDRLGDAEIYTERKDQTASSRSLGTAAEDTWITSAVKLRLMADDRTPGLSVNVDTNNGKVTLFGIVDSAEAKRAAEEDTRKVSGVKGVTNDLQVVASSRRDAVKAADDQVKQDVKASLARRDDLRDASIDVDVENGVARLTGTVPSQADRLAAVVTAWTASGVRAVRDDLRVKPEHQ